MRTCFLSHDTYQNRKKGTAPGQTQGVKRKRENRLAKPVFSGSVKNNLRDAHPLFIPRHNRVERLKIFNWRRS
jgi:hypothetical protein